jgi:hypothetical protein
MPENNMHVFLIKTESNKKISLNKRVKFDRYVTDLSGTIQIITLAQNCLVLTPAPSKLNYENYNHPSLVCSVCRLSRDKTNR